MCRDGNVGTFKLGDLVLDFFAPESADAPAADDSIGFQSVSQGGQEVGAADDNEADEADAYAKAFGGRKPMFKKRG